MSTMKRRIIYLTDEEWTWAIAYGKANGKTGSEVVRDAIALARGPRIVQHFDATDGRPQGQTPQQKRDAILRRINTKER